MKRLIFDIETDNLYHKMKHLHCLVVRDVDTDEVWRFNSQKQDIRKGIDLLDTADEIIGHNIVNFDIPVLARDNGGWKPKARLCDTLLLSRLIKTDLDEQDWAMRRTRPDFPIQMIGRHSLKAWGYRLELMKGDYIAQHGMDTWTQGLEDYCVQDTLVTKRLWQHFVNIEYSAEAIKLEHDFAVVMSEMEVRGFTFDKSKAIELMFTLNKRKDELSASLGKLFSADAVSMKSHLWLAGGKEFDTKKTAMAFEFKAKDIKKGEHKTKYISFNPASRDMIADRLMRKGWKPTEFTDNGKPTVDETVMSTLVSQFPEAAKLSEYLLVSKRLGQLVEGKEAWLRHETNGKIHGQVVTNGAVTGRCSHRHPNMGQVPSVTSPYGKECRALFKPAEGAVLVGVDASGLELRCLAHYLAPWDNGEYANEIIKGDIHTKNQLAAGLPTRASAKTFIYAFLYGAGDEKIGQVIGKGEAAGREIKTQFLNSLPALRRLKECIEDVIKTRAPRPYLVGLDGRHLFIRSKHAALNTLLQSAGALIVKKATVLMHRSLLEAGLIQRGDVGFVAHVHDEFQLECRPEVAEEVKSLGILSIRNAGLEFNFQCPLDGEARSGSNWAETH